MLKVISMLGLVVMIGALIGLYKIGVLFTSQHRSMSLWLGSNRCPLVFAKRRVGNPVATGCASANDM